MTSVSGKNIHKNVQNINVQIQMNGYNSISDTHHCLADLLDSNISMKRSEWKDFNKEIRCTQAKFP